MLVLSGNGLVWYDGCRYVGGNDNYNECLCIKNRCETMNVNKVITILNINGKSRNKKNVWSYKY